MNPFTAANNGGSYWWQPQKNKELKLINEGKGITPDDTIPASKSSGPQKPSTSI
jgi:hypothetical protein